MDVKRKRKKRAKVENLPKIEETPAESQPVMAIGSQSVKRTGVRKWLWALLVVVILAGAGVAAYYYLYPSNQKVADNSSKSVATHFASTKELVDKVKSDLKGTELAVATADGMGGKTADGFWAYSFPSYQPSGSKFKSLPLKGDGVGLKGDSTVADSNYKALVDFFAANKFKSIDGTDNKLGPIGMNIADVNYPAYDVYGSDNIMCAIFHADASGTTLKAHVVGIGCADKSDYKKAADSLAPFYAAYTLGDKIPPANLVFGAPVEADGKNGYKNVQVYQEDAAQPATEDGKINFVGFYYKAAADKDWTYATGSHSVPLCSMFGTDVLKIAFAGTSCVDDTTKKTVALQ